MHHFSILRRQAGFSLVELLIVVAIIGMLISLAMPAIQSSREASRRTQCLNNIRQIGIAFHGYHNIQKALPPSRIKNDCLTWAALVLANLEEPVLAALVDPLTEFPQHSEQFRLTPVGIYLCPSRDRDTLTTGLLTHEGIKADYGVMTSTFFAKGENGQFFDGATIPAKWVIKEDADSNRLLSWKSRTAFKDVTDGLSKTFLLTEMSLWAAERTSAYDGDNNVGAFLGDTVVPPDYIDFASDQLRPIAELEDARRSGAYVGSAHPDVVNVVLADGSSRSVRKDADLQVLEGLVTRSGGEATAIEEVAN